MNLLSVLVKNGTHIEFNIGKLFKGVLHMICVQIKLKWQKADLFSLDQIVQVNIDCHACKVKFFPLRNVAEFARVSCHNLYILWMIFEKCQLWCFFNDVSKKSYQIIAMQLLVQKKHMHWFHTCFDPIKFDIFSFILRHSGSFIWAANLQCAEQSVVILRTKIRLVF